MASLVLFDATPLSGPDNERGLGTCVRGLMGALRAPPGHERPELLLLADHMAPDRFVTHCLPIIAGDISAPNEALASTGLRVRDFAPGRWAEVFDGLAEDAPLPGDLAAGSRARVKALSWTHSGERTRAADAELCDE